MGDDRESYIALCAGTYIGRSGNWFLVVHQKNANGLNALGQQVLAPQTLDFLLTFDTSAPIPFLANV